MSLHPDVTLRTHTLHPQLVYDGAVMVRSHVRLLAPDGTPLDAYHNHYHRVNPADWWDITLRHLAQRVAISHHAALGLAAPDPAPLHLHPEGHPHAPHGPRPEPPRSPFAPQVRLRTRYLTLQALYSGHLRVQHTAEAWHPDGLPVRLEHSYDHDTPPGDWSEVPLRLLVQRAIMAHHVHWGLRLPTPEEMPMHVRTAHPHAAYVMPGGPTIHAALPALSLNDLRDHLIAQKEREIAGMNRAPYHIDPQTHPLSKEITPHG